MEPYVETFTKVGPVDKVETVDKHQEQASGLDPLKRLDPLKMQMLDPLDKQCIRIRIFKSN